ncbi:unnamed protein product [Spirodela intermedia]|uniref:Homeobox domain-containing protein n=1 Tax=Spirodela intermedia TaxID=51605 RepID=A0A7I8LBM7_SPIIN|nr:unnamed protein product [Spirodela intermedia]
MEGEPCNTNLTLGLGVIHSDVVDIASQDLRQRGVAGRPSCLHHSLFPPSDVGEIDQDQEKDQGLWRSSLSTASEDEDEDISNTGPSEADGGNKKNIRLTREHSAVLERVFRTQSTVTTSVKQELADRLNLHPRQIEVWNKLKRMEVNYELMNKCCESLTCENQQLKEELKKLRSMMTPSVCPSCQRLKEELHCSLPTDPHVNDA